MKLRPHVFFWLVVCPLLLGAQPAGLSRSLELALHNFRGRVGVAVVYGRGDSLLVAGDTAHSYPLSSVVKFHQALYVLGRAPGCGISLDSALTLAPAEMVRDTWSPLRDRYPSGGVRLTVADLLRYTLQQSDNVACDALFRRFGSPGRVEAYVRSLGFHGCRVGATEAEMHADPSRAAANRSTPVDAACLFYEFPAAGWLAPEAQAFVCDALLGCTTGTDRLPAGLAGTEARIGHKTGTGFRDARGRMQGFNDVGFVLLPDGRRYAMAVFIDDALASDADCAALMARLSALVFRAFASQPAEAAR